MKVKKELWLILAVSAGVGIYLIMRNKKLQKVLTGQTTGAGQTGTSVTNPTPSTTLPKSNILYFKNGGVAPNIKAGDTITLPQGTVVYEWQDKWVNAGTATTSFSVTIADIRADGYYGFTGRPPRLAR